MLPMLENVDSASCVVVAVDTLAEPNIGRMKFVVIGTELPISLYCSEIEEKYTRPTSDTMAHDASSGKFVLPVAVDCIHPSQYSPGGTAELPSPVPAGMKIPRCALRCASGPDNPKLLLKLFWFVLVLLNCVVPVVPVLPYVTPPSDPTCDTKPTEYAVVSEHVALLTFAFQLADAEYPADIEWVIEAYEMRLL